MSNTGDRAECAAGMQVIEIPLVCPSGLHPFPVSASFIPDRRDGTVGWRWVCKNCKAIKGRAKGTRVEEVSPDELARRAAHLREKRAAALRMAGLS